MRLLSQFTAHLLMLACLAQPALAVPEIATLNGQMVHGQTVTISGTGFGAHANYNNLSDTWQGQPFLNFRFKDFEDQQFSPGGCRGEWLLLWAGQ